MKIPLVRPAPPQLSLAIAELRSLEESGIFSNLGPLTHGSNWKCWIAFSVVKVPARRFDATIGLMLAIKDAVGEQSLQNLP